MGGHIVSDIFFIHDGITDNYYLVSGQWTTEDRTGTSYCIPRTDQSENFSDINSETLFHLILQSYELE